MHSMPSTTVSPNGKWLACQSMDNQIIIFNVLNRMKMMRKKVFKGHMVRILNIFFHVFYRPSYSWFDESSDKMEKETDILAITEGEVL